MYESPLLGIIQCGAILIVMLALVILEWWVAPRVSSDRRRFIRILSIIGLICMVLLFALSISFLS
jgi:hypothetical protein